MNLNTSLFTEMLCDVAIKLDKARWRDKNLEKIIAASEFQMLASGILLERYQFSEPSLS